MLTDLPVLILGLVVGFLIMRAGHVLLVLRPRRFRRLCEVHQKLLEDFRTAKYAWKQQVAAANQKAAQAVVRLKDLHQQYAKVNELRKEVDRLRKLNGETYQKYVRIQDRYDQLSQGRSSRI
jgi:uncharacterized membrane protein YgaE (UPF0421/DUF939 family)